MKKTILFVACLSFSLTLFAAGETPKIPDETLIAQGEDPVPPGFVGDLNIGPPDEDDVDPRVLRDFIQSRGLIECRQKCGQLIIAADVRAKWNITGEKVESDKKPGVLIKKRGLGALKPLNTFKSEVNLFLDYETKNSWASTKFRWTAIDGIDSGSETRTELDRAFIGYDVFMDGEEDFYIEIGRSKLDYVFDSRVEFGNFFDGLHLYYTNSWSGIGNFVIHGGPFIIDASSNHFGWIVETYVSKWMGTGFVFKYSIIDWARHSETRYIGKITKEKYDINPPKFLNDNPRYKFIVSQLLIGYEKKIDFLGCKSLYAYGAILKNHDPKRSPTTRNKKLNQAWYAGFTLGKLCKACDWSFDINYQSVQALAIPEFDLSGIGHGNADGSFIYDFVIANKSPYLARGFTNYKGWQISLLYAMTDTLSIRTKAEWSTPRNKSIGGDFFYKNYEMSVIYAF